MGASRTAQTTVMTTVLLISLCIFALIWPLPCLATTFVVSNTNDSGAGSLRQAILDANGSIGTDDIAFNIPGAGPHTISPLTDLPWISGQTSIDGWTQGGVGYTGPPLIEIESPDTIT